MGSSETNSARRSAGLLLLAAVAGCSHSQTAPTPVASGGGTSSTSGSSSVASKTAAPWYNAAPNLSPASVPDLTAPIDVAMVLCGSALNLAPCGMITTGLNDTMTCFAGCQTQIETVVSLMIERAAVQCAALPEPEAGTRECELRFPPNAAIDAKVAGKRCDDLCEEVAARSSRP